MTPAPSPAVPPEGRARRMVGHLLMLYGAVSIGISLLALIGLARGFAFYPWRIVVALVGGFVLFAVGGLLAEEPPHAAR